MENFIKPPPNTKLPSERQTSTPENTNSERDLERDESINTSSGREVANAEGAAGDLTHNTSHDLEEIYNSNQDIPDGLIPEDVTASEASTSNLSLSSTFAPVGTLTESVPIEIDDAQSTRRVSQPAPRSPLSPSSRQKVAKSPPRKESSSPLLPEKTRSQLTILKKIKRRARAAATLALPVTLALACGATIAAIGAPGVAMAGRHLKGTEATVLMCKLGDEI
ncbi:hypothetical protein CspeluHIS016_0114220 [Cutaneotrichosporon spelunceum]|uniref:Uncharacterized protein n=1 Tax=Cutaneotrichosporon spelunceum TaxID=1672016 RepID=A0AAD3TPX0_9TREE|nr:hypothetical protein CspeluHIS016_0114220 [Cutaneotrichosporon spelunceum]